MTLIRHFAALHRHQRASIVRGGHRFLKQIRRELEDYFAGRSVEFATPLAPGGFDFQQRTWKLLQTHSAGGNALVFVDVPRS